MTAFGRSTFTYGQIPYSVEIRTTNSRFLDVRVYLPWGLPDVERQVVKRIREWLKRGRVEVSIKKGLVETANTRETQKAFLTSRFQRVHETLKEIKNDLNIEGSIELATVLKAQTVFGENLDPPVRSEELLENLLPELDEALEALLKMRKQDGAAMDRAMADSLEAVTVLSDSILALAAEVPKSIKRRLEERLSCLISSDPPSGCVDSIRLAQEVAILADKADITEEVTRIKSHIEQIRASRKSEPPHGRKLEFLIQEIQREVNTAASKTPDVRIARAAVEIKTEIERMREIAQNVE